MLSYLLGNKGKDLENLFLTSFNLTKNGDLKTPYIRRLIFSAFLHTLSFLSVMMIFYRWNFGLGFGMIFFIAIVLMPYSFLYHIKMRALISYLSYACITNKKTTLDIANAKISEVAWSLRFLSLMEYLIANRGGENQKGEGVMSFLKNIIIGIIVAVIDVAENYLLPTIVIEQTSIKDAVPKLKQMKNNIPASLAGAFGFDMIGDAISSFSLLIYVGIFGAGAGISFALGSIVPVGLRTTLGGHQLFLLPAMFSLFFCHYIGSFIKISATSLKAIYFSIFYTSINRPLEIDEQYRDNVTNYLTFKDSSALDSFKKDVKNIFPHTAKGPASSIAKPNSNLINKNPVSKPSTQTATKASAEEVKEKVSTQKTPGKSSHHVKPELMANARSYVEKMQKTGSSNQEIIDYFTKKGWPVDITNQLLESNKKTG